jgi:hypothetical protein
MRSIPRTIGVNASLGLVPIAGYVVSIILESAHLIQPSAGSWFVWLVAISVGALAWVNRGLFPTYPRWVRVVLIPSIGLSVVVALFLAGMVAIAVTGGVPP